MGMFDFSDDEVLNEEELQNLNEEEKEDTDEDKKEDKKDKDDKEDKKDNKDKDEDKKEDKKDKDDDKDDDDDDDEEEDDEIKDEEVIDSFILNEAAMDDLISLNESEKINFNREKKIKWVTKEQKLKRLTYKICILMAKKANDAEYRKWAKGRAIVITARKKMMLKYKIKALARARKVIAAYRAGKFAGLLQDKRDIAQPKGIQKT